MKKVVIVILLIAVLAACLVLPACKKQTEGVVFYHTMGKSLREVLQKYIRIFNEQHPDIVITESAIGGYNDVRDQVINELQAGKQPAIAYAYADHVATYLMTKKVVDLNTYINDPEVGLTQAQKDDFIQGYYAEGSAFGDPDKMYTLPFSKSTEVMYYNIDKFNELHLAVPDHWFAVDDNDTTSLEYVIKALKAADPDCIPLGYDSEANWFITMCEQLGTPYTAAADRVEDRFLFNNDANVAFLNKFREWYQAGLLTTQEDYGSYTSGLFTNIKKKDKDTGKIIRSYISIGSSAGATHQCPEALDDGSYPFQVGIAEIPQADPNNKKVISQGPSLVMLQQSDSKLNDQAWTFIKFLLTNSEFQAEFSMASGYVPVLKSAFSLPGYEAFLEDAGTDKNGIAALSAKICMEQEEHYFTSPAFVGSSDARDQVGEMLLKYMSSKDGSETALRKILQDAVNRCISNNK